MNYPLITKLKNSIKFTAILMDYSEQEETSK
jgi:hypothetical protein